MGASTSPMTGAMRRSDSCSSTYQAARPSHQAVEAKTPSNPMPAKSAWRDQFKPRRPGPETTGCLAAGRADDLLQGFARERLQADQPKSRGSCPHQAGETLRPPRHEPVDGIRPQSRSRPGRRILAGIDDAARVVASHRGRRPRAHWDRLLPAGRARCRETAANLSRCTARRSRAPPFRAIRQCPILGLSPPDRKSGRDRRLPAQRSARRRDGRNPVERQWRRAGASPAGKRHVEGGDNKSWAYQRAHASSPRESLPRPSTK